MTVTDSEQSTNGGILGTDEYAPGEDRPLRHYAVMSTIFAAGMAGALVAGKRSGRLPDRIPAADLVVIGFATHKISRVVSKSKIGGFFRAPFTRFEGMAGQGEVSESARGTGTRFAIGELLLCPYCLSQWTSAGLMGGYMFDPRLIRFISSVYTAQTIADFLQLGYYAGEKRA
jgi:hypothetical protein